MSDEKDLIKKRGSFKGRLTTFKNYLQGLDGTLDTASKAGELRLRAGKLESLYEQYDEVQLQIECLSDDMQTQLTERSEFESLYYKSLSIAQDLLDDYNKNLSDINSCKGRSGNNHKLVKLPTIQLPKFSGSYENWLEFHDTFTSLIHSNDEIDEINKFHYLRASLVGSAALVIQSIEFSAKNYLVAWDLLCQRYDNKRLLIQNHVSALFNINSINKESSVALKQLIDQLNKNLRALDSLGEPVYHWDTLLIYIVTQKLDPKTYREWEEFKGHLDKEKSVQFDSFLQFLHNRSDLIETLELSHNGNRFQTKLHDKSNLKLKSMVSVQSSSSSNKESIARVCPKCKGDHNLNVCPQFLTLSNEGRFKILPSLRVCFNCLKVGHIANSCRKPGCKMCKRRHNTLVHVSETKLATNICNKTSYSDQVCGNTQSEATTPHVTTQPSSSLDNSSVALSASMSTSQEALYAHDVLLSTSMVKVIDSNNSEHIVRAVLDSGSTSCMITEDLSLKLNLTTDSIDKSILGISNVSAHVGKTCKVNLKSLDDSFTANIACYVLPSITSNVPYRDLDISGLKIPSNICLADPMFYKPSRVDILIGADLFWDLVGTQQIRLGNNLPVLCETRLGWIISGPLPIKHVSLLTSDVICNFVQVNSNAGLISDIQTDLKRFWQLEEFNSESDHLLPDEKFCEEHFVKNTTRLDSGRFCVRIPLRESPDVLGDSFQRSNNCLRSLERRLNNKPDLYNMYHDFMSEYQSLGHMTEITQPNLKAPAYFMPHHGVVREGSTTTKLRVVYNASSPTTSGLSFNDIQMVGPTVQDDLLSILLRFRQHKFILSADVEKMYRQIVVHPCDRYLQQILWRDSPDEPVKVFQLNTVTYGTASAPYLATRCLHQIGQNCEDQSIGEIIKHDFYVDDLLTGADDFDKVQCIRKQVSDELAAAGMPLRKWLSNDVRLVSEGYQTTLNLNMGEHEPNKLLGLGWLASSDQLCFPIGSSLSNGNTKRDLLSAIARIFDPLGLIAPVVIVMKMLLQQLWIHKLSWDDPLTPEICKSWNDIIKNLALLNDIRIPRLVICDSYKMIELHIFMDASNCAYGACVYVRSEKCDGEVTVRLLTAKSRVAPIKSLTIPRLELCGALMGARLYEKVTNSLRLKIERAYFWTDSTIVLGWLRMLPSRLQTFVRNRVAEILDKAGDCTWKHVPTKENPADLVSRGVDISNLQTLDLWWSGPEFLKRAQCNWPSQPKHLETTLETRQDLTLSSVVDGYDNFIEFNRFSNYSRLVRTVAYVIRFIKSCQKQTNASFLQEHELQNALNVIIRKSQLESFEEYGLLINERNLPKKSSLLKFNVFLDEQNIMRVGGRLGNSEYPYDKKYPILLQSTHVFTKLLFKFEHKKLLHAGPQLLLASIRENYWPIGGRNLARACFRQCVTCSRIRAKIVTPLMGNLPQSRVTAGAFPFATVGVDYAGPVMCASRQGRGCKLVKVYIAVFICFTTKAMHLELVSDLTSNNYILALRRFISRRGKPSHIYSDNGTSFVGACNELSMFLKGNCNSLSEGFANEGINFHFIPAYTPHFGGLWEAGVKSTKFHLERVLGNCNLTFEELYTTLTLIEAVLNSRPLTPLSSDPADCNPLTPSHFLIGRSLTSMPQRDIQQYSINHITRFQRIEQLRQHFWTRWSKEYIAELQQRVKWRSCTAALKLHSLVVIKEDNLPPLKWKLGRVVAVHPGSDGIVRVADILTSSGVIRRAFNRICPLPITTDSG